MLLIWIVVAVIIGMLIGGCVIQLTGRPMRQHEMTELQQAHAELTNQIKLLREQYRSKSLENQSLYERLVAQDEVIQNYQQELKRNDHLLDHLRTQLNHLSDHFEALIQSELDIHQQIEHVEQHVAQHQHAKEHIFNDLTQTTDELYSLRARLKMKMMAMSPMTLSSTMPM